jgi:hypothetical protein
MANDSSKLSVRDGLITVVSAERFQRKPRADGKVQVVVMQKTGKSLRHYVTLRSARDTLRLGEEVWGDYICYIVDMSLRKLHMERDFATRDRITNVHLQADISYRVTDGELVAIGVEDALQALQDELITLLKREIIRLTLDQVSEQYLESLIQKESLNLESWLGIRIEKIRITGVDWDKAVLDDIRVRREEKRKIEREDRERQRRVQLEDADRRRKQQLEKEDIDHVNDVLEQLGLNALPADARLKLLSMPREKAFDKIGEYIEQQRSLMQDVFKQRAQEEYALLREMIDRGILEDFELQDFGKTLLHRYSHMFTAQELLGAPPSLLFGDSHRNLLGDNKKSKGKSGKNRATEDDEDTESD